MSWCVCPGHPACDPIGKDPIDDARDKEQHAPEIIMGGKGDDTELEAHECANPATPDHPVKRDYIGTTDQESLECPAVNDHHHKPRLRCDARGSDDQQAPGAVQAGEDADDRSDYEPFQVNHIQSIVMRRLRKNNIVVFILQGNALSGHWREGSGAGSSVMPGNPAVIHNSGRNHHPAFHNPEKDPGIGNRQIAFCSAAGSSRNHGTMILLPTRAEERGKAGNTGQWKAEG